MKLSTLRIPCENLKNSELFYSNMLDMNKLFGSETEGFIGYQLENIQILLELEEKGEFECGRYLGFSLEVDDINEFYLVSKGKGVTFTGTPEKQAWGGLMTHVVDCNQNSFSIVQTKA